MQLGDTDDLMSTLRCACVAIKIKGYLFIFCLRNDVDRCSGCAYGQFSSLFYGSF